MGRSPVSDKANQANEVSEKPNQANDKLGDPTPVPADEPSRKGRNPLEGLFARYPARRWSRYRVRARDAFEEIVIEEHFPANMPCEEPADETRQARSRTVFRIKTVLVLGVAMLILALVSL